MQRLSRNARDASGDGFPDRQTLRRATAALASFGTGQSSGDSATRQASRGRQSNTSPKDWMKPGPGPGNPPPPTDASSAQGRHGKANTAQAAEVQALREEVAHLRGLLEVLQLGPPDADPSHLAWMKLVAHTAQLQRQVAVLDAELQASRAVAAEAEASLVEVQGGLQQLHGRCEVADVCGACGGPLLAMVERQLQRLQRQRAQVADVLSRSSVAASEPDSGWGTGRDTGPSAHPSSCHIPYTPAGGNRFLQSHRAAAAAGTSTSSSGSQPLLTVPAVGRARPGLPDPSQVMELQEQLCHLGPRLAGLSVLLHTALLPALPWVAPAVRQQLEGELEATTRDVTHAASALVELGCASAAGGAVATQQGKRPGSSGVLGLSELPPALKSLHAEFQGALEDMRGRVGGLPWDQRPGLKVALTAGQQLADRYLEEASALGQRCSMVLQEVQWVAANVAQQAEAVWQLLYADANGGAAGRGNARLPTADTADSHLLAAAGLHRVHEAVVQVATAPSEEALKDLVHCAITQQQHIGAAAQQQEHLAHTVAALQASVTVPGVRGCR